MTLRILPVCVFLTAALPAASQDIERIARASILEGWRQADGSHVVAVRVELEPGWHTYWRVPGESGISPQFDWSGSENVGSVSYEWPRPTVFENFGMLSFGYENELVLPVRITPKEEGAPIELALSVFYGVCDEICMPAQAEFSASLPSSGQAVERDGIERALKQRPVSASDAGVKSADCTLVLSDDGTELQTSVIFDGPLLHEQTVVVESSDDNVWIAPARSRTKGAQVVANARVGDLGGDGLLLDRSALRITVLDSARAVDIQGCKAPA